MAARADNKDAKTTAPHPPQLTEQQVATGNERLKLMRCALRETVTKLGQVGDAKEELAAVAQARKTMDDTAAAIEVLREQLRSGPDKYLIGTGYRRRDRNELAKLLEQQKLQQALRETKEEYEKRIQFETQLRLVKEAEIAATDAKMKLSLESRIADKETEFKKASETWQTASAQLNDKLTKLGIANVGTDSKSYAVTIKQLEDRTREHKIAIDQIEAKAGQKRPEPARDLSKLEADIKATNWILNPREKQSSSEMIQRLEATQRAIEDGKEPKTHDFAPIDHYFMFSESRQCAIALCKVAAKPAKWDYKYYYVASSIAQVQRIFEKCNGKPVVNKLVQTTINKLEFADVPPAPSTTT